MSSKEVTRFTLKVGGRYNWKGQLDKLVYEGKSGRWHQFSKVSKPGVVWCELLDGDLINIEETR